MEKSTQKIYEVHHATERAEDFSILEKERGTLFKEMIGTGKKVLDLGCRNGVLTRHFLEGNEVTGADIDTVALSKAQKLGISTIHIDLNGGWSELHGKTYDVVVLAETLEHLYYPEQVVKKVKGVLTPEGMLIGSVPNAFSLKNRIRLVFAQKKHTPLGDPTHINHFSRKELTSLFTSNFKNVKIIPLGRFAFLDTVFPGMFSFDLAFVCKEKIEKE